MRGPGLCGDAPVAGDDVAPVAGVGWEPDLHISGPGLALSTASAGATNHLWNTDNTSLVTRDCIISQTGAINYHYIITLLHIKPLN